MATMNKNGFIKSAQEHNITGYQLIMGKAKNNVIGMLYGGYQFDRLSLFTRLDIDMLMEDIACNGVKVAYEHHTYNRKSVAKQKVNEAHGRMDGERVVNYIMQLMTYANPFENIQFKGQTWVSVLNQLIEREQDSEISKVANWIESMKEFHASKAKKIVFELINNKEVRILDGHVIPEKTFERFLSQFCKENNLKELEDVEMKELINKYCERFQEVVGV